MPLADIYRCRLTTNRRDIQRYMQRKNLCTRFLLISRITSNSRHGSDYIMLLTQDLWDRNVLGDKVTTPRIKAIKRIRQKNHVLYKLSVIRNGMFVAMAATTAPIPKLTSMMGNAQHKSVPVEVNNIIQPHFV